MYIHVHVVMYLYVHGINMYVPCSDTYVPFCPILSRWVGFQMRDRDPLQVGPASGILYTWTGLGKSVHTGTYQYVPVQHGIRPGQYENFTVVHTGMYRYIPVRTFNKTSCFLTHPGPERVRRDKIKVVKLLCLGYNATKSNFKTTQV